MIPVLFPPLDPAHAERALDAVDGLVLSGGEDVSPALYGASRHPALGEVNDERDRWELALTTAARDRRLPLFAICRGIQVLNVALGGTLIQDIPSECPAALSHAPRGPRDARVHDVSIDADSRIAGAVHAATIAVNSIHHQAIARIAPGLRATAWSPDGIVEGAEWEGDDWWAVGVQWHPEEMTKTPESWDRGLFDAFRERLRG